jgi:4-hydroxybenzoate polyprenyltransferase
MFANTLNFDMEPRARPGSRQEIDHASRPSTAGREGVLVSALRRWGGFVKFSHTVFALPFALASMALAARDQRGWPGARVFLLIVAAMTCARTCAMSFNRIADREFDRANPRTAGRHLPRGEISLAGAWTLCLASGAGLIASAFFLNPVCFYLSPVALLVVCFYSLTKRFTDFTHVFLGLALALAPIGAWLAVKGSFHLWPDGYGWRVLQYSAILPLLLAAAVLFWLVGFDIIYAVQDYEFDRRNGLHSLVVRWGVSNALSASFLCHMVMWLLLAVFGFLAGLRLAYGAGLIFILVCLLLEHGLARRRRLDWIQLAFFRLNALIGVVFLVVTLTEIVFPWMRFKR